MTKNTVDAVKYSVCACASRCLNSSAGRLCEFCDATIHFPHPELLEASPGVWTCLQSPATGSCREGSRCPPGWLGSSCRGCTEWSCVRAIPPRTASPIVRSTAQKPRPVGTDRPELGFKSRLSFTTAESVSYQWDNKSDLMSVRVPGLS